MSSGSETRRAKFQPAAALLAAALAAGAAGCHDDKPHDYGEQRGSINDIDRGDRGLQGKDVNQAADQMAADLLADPKLNATRARWTLVVDHITDQTTDHVGRVNFDIFLQALKVRLARQGGDRITLITNRAKFRDLRGRELEGGGPDPYGQGGAGGGGAPDAINPDFALSGTVIDLPNRKNNYYQIEFSIDDLHLRRNVWEGMYAVKVAR